MIRPKHQIKHFFILCSIRFPVWIASLGIPSQKPPVSLLEKTLEVRFTFFLFGMGL
jgi:hypothetical protein